MALTNDIPFRKPSDVRRAMARAMNDTLQGKTNKQYGILANLGNTWLKAFHLEYELGEFQKLKEQFQELQLQMRDGPSRRR